MPRNKTVPVVLLGRYTTLAGSTTFKTIPINISGYSSIKLAVWRGDMEDPGWTFTFDLEESMDQESWVQIATKTVGSDVQEEVGSNLTRTWLRAAVALGSGGFPVASCYAVGYLLRRRK